MTATVPTAAEHAALAQRLKAAEDALAELQQTPPPGAAEPFVLRPEQFGARPGADCTAAFRSMFAALEGAQGLKADAGGSVQVARAVVLLGEGPYLVSGPIMGPRAGRAQGLTVRGLGKRASEIVMTGPGPLLENRDRWMGVTWENCGFRSANPKAAFLYSYSTGACQDWNFVRCEWRGTWHYGIGLDGPAASNTNSEWVFDRCTVLGSYEVAWLWSGMSPEHAQQDQFLNFSLRDMKMELTSGDALRFNKGGSIVVTGGSWIMQGQRADGQPSRFFHFPPGSHFDSVQSLLVQGVRFEPRNPLAMVIDSAWNGQVTFINCMDDALGFQAFSKAESFTPHRYTSPGGVMYIGCHLVGRHRYDAPSPLSRQVAVYQSCARKNWRTAAGFFVKTGTHAAKLKVQHIADRDGIT